MSFDLVKVFWISFGRVSVQFFSIIVFFFSAKYLTASEYGLFSLITTALIFSELTARECIENYVLTRKNDFAVVYKLSWVIGSVLGLLVVFSLTMLLDGVKFYSLTSLLVFAVVVFQWPAAAVKGALLSSLAIKKLNKTLILPSSIASVLAILLLIQNFGLDALLLQQSVMWAGICLSGYFTVKPFVKTGKSNFTIREWSNHSFLGLGSAALTVTSNRLDFFVISSFFNMHDVGIYAFVKRIYQIVSNMLSGGIERYLIVFQSKSSTDSFLKNSIKTKVYMFFIMLITVVIITFLAPIILPLFFQNKWEDTYPLFIFMGGMAIFSSLLSLARADLYAKKEMKNITIGKGIELIISVSLIFSLGLLGIEEMALANSLRYLLVFLIIYSLVLKNISNIHHGYLLTINLLCFSVCFMFFLVTINTWWGI